MISEILNYYKLMLAMVKKRWWK